MKASNDKIKIMVRKPAKGAILQQCLVFISFLFVVGFFLMDSYVLVFITMGVVCLLVLIWGLNLHKFEVAQKLQHISISSQSLKLGFTDGANIKGEIFWRDVTSCSVERLGATSQSIRRLLVFYGTHNLPSTKWPDTMRIEFGDTDYGRIKTRSVCLQDVFEESLDTIKERCDRFIETKK